MDNSAKDVYEWLIAQGYINSFPPCEEGKFLLIRSLCMNKEAADTFKKVGRVMSGKRGNPLSFYSNPSNGTHSGFLVRRSDSFDQIYDWYNSLTSEITDSIDGEDIRPYLQRIINILIEMDPSEEYRLYLYD